MSQAIEARPAPGWAAKLDLLILAINCAAALCFGWWLGHVSPHKADAASALPPYYVQKVFVCAPPANPNCDGAEIWLDYQRAKAEAWHHPGV